MGSIVAGRTVAALASALGRRQVRLWASPVGAGAASLAVYTLLAVLFNPNGLGQSPHPYFVYLADAFLHGQLALVHIPSNTHDLSIYEGRYYLYWPPFSAVPFIPLVAAFGLGVSDVALSLAVGVLNVGLVSSLLGALDSRQLIPLSAPKRAWLTASFALGTVHLAIVPYGRVWHTHQLIGFALLCAAYLAAVKASGHRAALASGTLMGCAFLTRSMLPLAGIWTGWLLMRAGNRPAHLTGRPRRDDSRGGVSADGPAPAKIALAGLAPLAIAVALQVAYNYLRFGNPLEFGATYQQHQYSIPTSAFPPEDLAAGLFGIQRIPRNFYYQFVAFPYLALFGPEPQVYFWMGGSLFLMSPIFFLAIPGLARSWRSHGWPLAASMVAGAVPLLTVVGTGWVQFGPRYTLDITVPLLLATAIGAAEAPTVLVAGLALVGFALYLPGTILFGMFVA